MQFASRASNRWWRRKMTRRYAWLTLVVIAGCSLPDSSVTPASEPFTAVEGNRGELVVGGVQACARRGGGFWCWGMNDDTGFRKSDAIACPDRLFCETASRVRELDGAVQVAFELVGKACLVSGAGQLWCRGAVTGSARGDSVISTTRWLFDAPVVEVALGGGYLCVRHPNGAVSCWGDVIFTGGPAPAHPRYVPGLTDATQLAAGSQHACALRRGGTVVCWGSNRVGQLGVEKDPPCPSGQVGAACALVPSQVEGLGDVAEIVAGAYFTCARQRSGAVFCWGVDQMGELGESTAGTCDPPLLPIGRAACSRSPLRVRGVDAVRIASGSHHSCAVEANGHVVCWGSNLLGELGASLSEHCPPTGRYPCSTRPVDVGLTDVVDVAVGGVFMPIGGGYSCAETRAKEVYCWGTTGEFAPGMEVPFRGPHPSPRKIAFSD